MEHELKIALKNLDDQALRREFEKFADFTNGQGQPNPRMGKVCVFVCLKEREGGESVCVCVKCVCVLRVCVREREREKQRERESVCQTRILACARSLSFCHMRRRTHVMLYV